MNISYKRQHSDSYMVIDTKLSEMTYEEKMIEKNNIQSLLPISTMVINGNTQYFYNISKMESLRDYMESTDITKTIIQRFLINLHLSLEELGKYLINQNHIVLTPETIYLEKSNDSFKVFLCYNPMIDETIQIQLRGILEWMLTLKSEEVYEIYDISLKNDYTVMELVEALEDRNTEPEVMEKHNIEVQQVVIEDEEEYLSDEYNQEESESFVSQILSFFSGKAVNLKKDVSLGIRRESEDFVIEPDMDFTEPTVLIRPQELPPQGKLVYDGNSLEESYMVSGEVFRVGSAENNHGRLHSKAVSRHHAKIVKIGEDFLIEDLNSTNGTFLNGKLIGYRQPIKLKAMDEIRFGDVSYVFM